ncbi:MAG: hypothetical protein U0572_11100 [Phycisphaerales bacterium]
MVSGRRRNSVIAEWCGRGRRFVGALAAVALSLLPIAPGSSSAWAAFLGSPRNDGDCAVIDTDSMLCREDGSFAWTFTLTNQSGQPISVAIFDSPFVSPQVTPFNPPLSNGGSTALQLTISGLAPGTQLCFPLVLGSVLGNVCCHREVCIDLPDCDCAQATHVQFVATATPGTYALSFTLTNLSPWQMGHVVLFSNAAAMAPGIINLPATPPFASQSIGPIVVTTAAPAGSVICFTVGNHSVNWTECCFIELCAVVPHSGPDCPPADLNGDGVVNAADLAILLGNWGSPGLGDLNADGIVNAVDLATLLGMWGMTC